MIKRFFVLVIFLLSLHLAASSVFALSLVKPAPPQPSSSLLFGQQQNYTVTFRGNGEAVVLARMVFSNQKDVPLTELSFRIPKGQIQDQMAFQVIADRQCIQYNSSVCVEYRDPDYQYLGGSARYQKAKTGIEGDTLTVTLPTSVGQGYGGSILLAYRGFGYAKKNLFGAYEYAFETLKASESIQELTVGILTDSDLYLKGAKGKVNYGIMMDSASVSEMRMGAPAMPNSRLDQMYNQIGYGGLQKKATNLQPMESYTVKGTYADMAIKLYMKEVLVGIAVAIVFLMVFIFIGRRIMRVMSGSTRSVGVAAKGDTWGMVVGGSFLSSFFMLDYTILLVWLMQVLPRYSSQFILPVMLLVFVTSIGVYGLLLLGPGIYLGVRRGIGAGFAMIGLTMAWLVVYLLIYILGMVIFGPVLDRAVMMGSSGGVESVQMMQPEPAAK